MAVTAAARASTPAAVVVRAVECGPLAPVTLKVARGSAVALLGRNGAGKSTLLRVIAGLAPAARGHARAAGPIGYVPQDYRTSLFPWLSVADNVGLLLRGGAMSAGERARRVAEALAAVRLPAALRDRRPRALSGGEQQLVAVARALAAAPATLLLDEPFAALDIATRAMARRAVADYAQRAGATVIVVTHDVDDVVELADRAIVIGGEPRHVVADLSVHDADRESIRGALLRACERGAA